MKRVFTCLVAVVALSTTLIAENPQQAFAKTWTNRPVVVKATLYSLIYNERGKLGSTKSGLREGLVVVTPSEGGYFQFDGRQGRDQVVEKDLQRVVASVNAAYEPDSLDMRAYRKIEPVAINRYDPGVELLVTSARVDADQVKLEFAAAGGGDPVTSIRIKWPTPLSKAFTEREPMERLIRHFVDFK